jgi:nickel/cobalt transporter (NicO) family protein
MRAICRGVLVAVIATAALTVGTAAGAHPLGLPAFARITMDDSGVATVVWNAAPDDVGVLARSLGVPVPEGEGLTRAQDATFSASEQLRSALLDGIRMSQQGSACPAGVEVSSIVEQGATLRFACPDPGQPVDVQLSLLTDIDDRYRTLAVAGTVDGPQRFMFTSAAPTHRMTLDPATAAEIASGAAPSDDAGGAQQPFGGSLPFESQFVALIDRSAGVPALLLGLLIAMGVGAAHGLAPGHGKAIAAAYLVGDRGRPRDAVLLGLTVAGMHTWSVLALGFALYSATRRPATAALSGWLQLVTGVVVTAVGGWLLWRRTADRRREAGHTHPHQPAMQRHPLSWQGLVALGAAGGLLPSPSALLVLFTALAVGRLAYGLALIGVFSLGLAATVSVIGLAVLRGRDLLASRAGGAGDRWHRLLHAAPSLGAAVVLGFGVVLTVRAATAVVAAVPG